MQSQSSFVSDAYCCYAVRHKTKATFFNAPTICLAAGYGFKLTKRAEAVEIFTDFSTESLMQIS